MPMPTPAAITALLDAFARDTPNATATAEHLGGLRWRVTVASDRVLMWVEYEARSRGRLLAKNSQLFIDGEQAPLSTGYEQLTRIFNDPDRGRVDAPRPATADMDVVPVTDAPPPVRQAHAQLRPTVDRGGTTLTVRHAGRYWAVSLGNDRAELRMVFVETPLRHTRPLRETEVEPAHHNPIELTVDGVDHTDTVSGRLEKALEMLAHASAPAPPPVSGPAPAQVRTTGVQVRNTVVIRN